MRSYLHTPGQHGMKDVRSLFHDSDIFGSGVSALAVLDGVDEAVSEFAQWAQQVLFNETDHAVICKNKICRVNMRRLNSKSDWIYSSLSKTVLVSIQGMALEGKIEDWGKSMYFFISVVDLFLHTVGSFKYSKCCNAAEPPETQPVKSLTVCLQRCLNSQSQTSSGKFRSQHSSAPPHIPISI